MFLQLAVIVLIMVISVIWNRKNRYPPGPYGLPVVGYLPWLNPDAPHETLTKLSKTYGSIYGLYLGNVYTVVLSDHKLVRKVLAKEVTTGRAPLYLTHGIMKGYGLICAEKELWKDQRKFTSSCLKQFGIAKFGVKRNKIELVIIKEVTDFIKHIKTFDESALDPLEPLRHNVGSVVNMVVFGKSWPRDNALWKWLQYLQEEGTKHIGIAGPLNFLPFLSAVPKFKSTMTFLLEGKRKTHDIYQKIIAEQIELLDGNENEHDFEPDNVIQAFLMERERRKGTEDASKFYNDQQFYHLLADLFGAGLDTTLTTLRWYLLYMASCPEIQNRVQKEIDSVLHERQISLDDLPRMSYTEASLAEAQRIRSVVPVGIPHGTLDSMEINDYVIPKGTMIVPLQWAIHMNDDVWEEPDDFDPSRFLDEEGKFVRREAFIPFQTGKRMCIGDEFAKMLLFLFGASILREFRVSLLEPVDLRGECGITLTPKPHKLVFSARY